MKRRFIINFMLILAAAFAAIGAARLDMWFTFSGIVALCVYVIYRQIDLFCDYVDALENERLLFRKSQERLAETEKELQFYRTVIDGVDTAVIMSTDSGCIEWMNSTARLLVGDGELLPQSVIDAVRNRDAEVMFAGSEYSLGCSRVALRHSDRNIVVMKNIHSSIERNKVESWHKLVRVLTHEIMNSMTPIISLSETLCESARSDAFAAESENAENIHRGLEIIKRRSSGLLSFVENYRKLTRIAAPDKQPFALKGLLDDLRKLFSQPYIRFDAGNCEALALRADRAQMEQVFINLIKNSIEACEERGKCSEEYESEITFAVDVADDARGKCAVFSIKDNGIGIVASAKEQVFVPFFTTKKSGSGIGLSLCKQIVTNHGGSLEIDSEEGAGCVVRCCLPL